MNAGYDFDGKRQEDSGIVFGYLKKGETFNTDRETANFLIGELEGLVSVTPLKNRTPHHDVTVRFNDYDTLLASFEFSHKTQREEVYKRIQSDIVEARSPTRWSAVNVRHLYD